MFNEAKTTELFEEELASCHTSTWLFSTTKCPPWNLHFNDSAKDSYEFLLKYFIIIGSVVLEATTLIKAKFELKSRLDKQPTRV